MTADTDRMVVWLRNAMDAAQLDAEAAARAFAVWDFDECVKEIRDFPNAGTVAYVPIPEQGPHIARQSPASVLRRIAADRKLLGDILAEPHSAVPEDGFYSCGALTDPDVEGGCLDDLRLGKCDCGRDARVERRVRLLAEGYGWTEEAQCPTPS